MMEHEFLTSLVIIFGASALVVFLLHRLKIPSIVGFLIAGVIIGPYGIGIVKDTRSVEVMAEIGVILLLFTIGIEFSLTKIIRMKRAVIIGGGLQVIITITISAVIAYFANVPANSAIFFGFLIALSSTAIVMKTLAEKGQIDSPPGRIMIGILICQDLCVVPLMLLLPALSGEALGLADIALKMGKAVMIVAVVLLSARWIVPGLLNQIVGTRSRELFMMTIILLCLGIALLTSKFGLSLALGAFLAGLIISESEYAHQATSDILPFKDSFTGLFFVSVGMLVNINYMTAHFLPIAITVALIFVLKIAISTVSALAAGSSMRASIHAGLGLAQIGEFSFILALAGKAIGLITEEFYQIFLSSSIVTMIFTPFILNISPSVSAWITSSDLIKRLERHKKSSGGEGFPRKRQWHVIIIGFGLNGKNLAKVLKEANIPYVVLEMNSDTVREMKKKGEPIYFGDGTSKEILYKLNIEKARLLVVAISDPVSTRSIVAIARKENPDIYIIVRTRYIIEIDDLKALGANEVIPEEFETSIEIFSRVLNQYNFPYNVIMDMVDKIRSDSYNALRNIKLPKRDLFEKYDWLPEIEMDGFKVPQGSHLAGRSIGELQLRRKTDITIIAVRRKGEVFTNPGPDFRFEEGDIILFTGNMEGMNKALNYFKFKKDGLK